MNGDTKVQRRKVFYISDRTGHTAEVYGKSLLSQFPGQAFESCSCAFVDNVEKALRLVGEVDRAYIRSGLQPIVFTTLADSGVQRIIHASNACTIDLFAAFIEPLERCLDTESAHQQGLLPRITGDIDYQRRLNAIDYALSHDDGLRPDQYGAAEVVLVGVSRCGKTPTSLFLAMNFFIQAANYPLAEQELETDSLPASLQDSRDKLVALTIQPRQLSRIRQQRRPGSRYADIKVCEREVRAAQAIFAAAGLPVFDSTDTSIEEIAGCIVKEKNLLGRRGRERDQETLNE